MDFSGRCNDILPFFFDTYFFEEVRMAKHDISLYGKCTSTICAGKSHFDIRDEIFFIFL